MFISIKEKGGMMKKIVVNGSQYFLV